MAFKSGFVAVVGRPNAGKSTLVNCLVGHKVAIVTEKPQTTRNRILGVVHRDEAQIVLIDTPGLIPAHTALEKQMAEEIEQALEGIDLLALIVDSAAPFRPGDRFALERIARVPAKHFLLLNKIDRIEKEKLLPLMDLYRQAHEFAEIIPVSALSGDGIPLLVERLVAHLPEGPAYFPPDMVTDQPERFLAAEIIREKAMQATRQEVPHAIAVLVDSFEESAKLVRIRGTVYCEREGQKGILIGKSGATLKHIATQARLEIESLLGVKVFLELHVKVRRDWRDKPALVRQLDWRRQLEQLSQKQANSGE